MMPVKTGVQLSQDSTLNRLLEELAEDCQVTLDLLNQLRSPLSPDDRATIIAELVATTIHLHSHCDDSLQDRLWQEGDRLPDVDASEDLDS